MTIYHFGRTIQGLKMSLPSCPALNVGVDHPTLRIADKLFESIFPGSDEMRHLIAHVADFSRTREIQARHAVKGRFNKKWFLSEDPNGSTWLPGNMNNNVYAVTYEGNAFTYTLSLASTILSTLPR